MDRTRTKLPRRHSAYRMSERPTRCGPFFPTPVGQMSVLHGGGDSGDVRLKGPSRPLSRFYWIRGRTFTRTRRNPLLRADHPATPATPSFSSLRLSIRSVCRHTSRYRHHLAKPTAFDFPGNRMSRYGKHARYGKIKNGLC